VADHGHAPSDAAVEVTFRHVGAALRRAPSGRLRVRVYRLPASEATPLPAPVLERDDVRFATGDSLVVRAGALRPGEALRVTASAP
jgi:hypothetical protein